MMSRYYEKFIQCLIILSVSSFAITAHAGLSGDAHWKVEKGDSVYSIARKVFPDDSAKQKQFRAELVSANPAVFSGNANRMSVGDRLILPAFAVTQAVPAARPAEVAIEEQQPVLAADVEVKPDETRVTPDPEDVIGHVVISVGDMEANNRGVFRKLLRHSEVLRGDTLSTSNRSYTQIRMKDGALLSLRPNTQLKITDYRFNGKEDGSERSLMELINGGFRTITGYIGHRNKKNYRVKTAVATIGIRGTHYGLMVCAEGSCNDESTSLDDGVYGGVVDGSIVVENESGVARFNNDQYFYVASLTQSPIEQLVPPPVFHGHDERQAARQSGNADTEAGGSLQARRLKALAADRVSQKTIKGNRLGTLVQSYVDDRKPLPILRDQVTDVIKDVPTVITAPNGAGVLVALNAADLVTGIRDVVATGIAVIPSLNNSIVLGSRVDTGGMVISNIPVLIHEEKGSVIHDLALPSASNNLATVADTGGIGIGVNWGRWSGNFVLTENGVPVQSSPDMHYVYSDKLTSPSEIGDLKQLALLGGLQSLESYSLAGGTTPTTPNGQAGQLGNITVMSDFVNQQIDYSINAQTQQGTNFSMGALAVPFQNMAEFQLTDTGCSVSCEGQAAAAFIGSQAAGLMTTYSMQEIGSGVEGLNGAAVLTRDSAAIPVIPVQ